MLLEGFRLQIFVNGEPLKEYSEKYVENKTITSAGPSYIYDEVTKKTHTTDRIVYALVNKSDENKRFSIRFTYAKAKYSAPIKAYLFVDGVWDYTYYQIYDDCYYVEDGFWNKERDKKFYFKFVTATPTTLSPKKDAIIGKRGAMNGVIKYNDERIDEDDMDYSYNIHNNINDNGDNDQNEKRKNCIGGGCGTISVHFYKAEWHQYDTVKNNAVSPYFRNKGTYAARVRGLQTYDTISNLQEGDSYEYLRGQIYKEKDVSLSRSCFLGEKVLIGAGTKIAENTEITNSVIGRRVSIGPNVNIDGAYIWDDVIIKSNCSITCSILTNNVILQENVTVNKGCILSHGT
ncbi:1803_t:CDS:2 [Entrophospora sp. SA101]|nr:1803_t:CDS:2 [Entrophospora sp. SA101]